jgi:hypothetical protein
VLKLPDVWRFDGQNGSEILHKFGAKKCVHQPLFLALVRHMASADERAPLAMLEAANEPSFEVSGERGCAQSRAPSRDRWVQRANATKFSRIAALLEARATFPRAAHELRGFLIGSLSPTSPV